VQTPSAGINVLLMLLVGSAYLTVAAYISEAFPGNGVLGRFGGFSFADSRFWFYRTFALSSSNISIDKVSHRFGKTLIW
jgi:hypothetical protein